MSPTVLIIDAHADAYAAHLRGEFPDLAVHTARDIAELPAALSGFDVLIAFGTSIDDDVLRRLSGVTWVQSLATGVDHFLRCPYLSPDVQITSGRGIHGPMMREMAAKTAVVVGIGVSGSAIGELLSAFGMHVIGVTRTARQVNGFNSIMPTDRLIEAAGQADYLINVLPGSPENIGLFTREVFVAMKPTARFINIGRGETVDQDALIEALREKRIAGAALDVFSTRPLPPDSPLWEMPNVVITPHIGGYVVEYEDYVMPIVIENMRHFLAGRRDEMRNIVRR
jgi:D-2-hydroxyacid dehydrogenase (NADP+)